MKKENLIPGFGIMMLFVLVLPLLMAISSAAFAGVTEIKANSFIVKEDGHVYGSRQSATADFDSYFQLVVNGVETPGFIFNHGGNSRVDFGEFKAGDVVEFRLDVEDGNSYWNTASKNFDGLDHIDAFAFDLIHSGKFISVGFEDKMGLGDKDFDDARVYLYNVSAVPEPETYAMLLIGLGLVWLLRFRKEDTEPLPV